MPLLQVVVLAIVQGLTEFLPISSTAHLFLTSWLLGWNVESLTFDIALHIGTLIAVLVYFFRDWLQIAAQGFGLDYGRDPVLKQNPRLLWLLALGTSPAGVFGLLFNKQAETTWRTPLVMASMMIVVGLVMAWAERAGCRKRGMGDVSVADASVIGLSQALAIVPGTSRSGITISTGLFRGLTRESAARFSFLLSTPTIAGAAGKALHDLIKHHGISGATEADFLIGVLISAITGFLVIAWFMRFLQSRTLWFFVYYRIAFGALILLLWLKR